MPINHARLAALFTLACIASTASAQSWWATPIVVHEWGVQQFDWSKPRAVAPANLPTYIHTDTKPGLPVPAPAKRVKDLPPDNGMRFKPILYFYPSETPRDGMNVGVELRFAQGHANAWFPQANIYRTPAMTAGATPPDWVAWRKAHEGRIFDAKLQTPIPDDLRMELSWHSLALSKDLPAGAKLPGEDLPADHWTKLARNIPNAAYITNGNETEKYLFYEGATHEMPAVAVVTSNALNFMDDPRAAIPQVVNISDQSIYNIFAIYHLDGQTWIGYVSELAPIQTSSAPGGAGDTVATLPLPLNDLAKIKWADPQSLPALTTDRLLAALTEGGSLTINTGFRDPADPQGKTTSSQLYPEEAAALEKIWHHDFFDPAPLTPGAAAPDGLTIIYRESPAAIDSAMPLNIYTSMYYYISLSRCGLVLNTHIDLAQSAKSLQSVNTCINAPSNPGPEFTAQAAHALAFLKEHPILANSAITYSQKTGGDAKRLQLLREQLFPQ